MIQQFEIRRFDNCKHHETWNQRNITVEKTIDPLVHNKRDCDTLSFFHYKCGTFLGV